MIETCPPDGEFERLLANQLKDTARQALEAHLAGCPSCQRRWAEFTLGAQTLPTVPSHPERGRVDTHQAGGDLEQALAFLPAQPPFLTQRPETPPGAAGTLPPAFGRYRVDRILGAGGFGTVFLGHNTQLDRPVATKVLHCGTAVAPDQSELFLEEAHRLARLRHPSIVTVHDVGVQAAALLNALA